MKKNRIVILILSLAVSAYSVEAADDCMALFKKAYDKMIAMYERSAGTKGIYMQYHIEVINTDNEIYKDIVEMMSYKQKSKFVSSKVTIYQDAFSMVAIQPDSKTIFVTRPLGEDFRKIQTEGILKTHDSLFQFLVLKSCTKDALQSKKQYKKLSFEVAPAKQKKFGIKSVTYWINESEVQVVKMKIDYMENGAKPIKTSSYAIDKFDSEFSKSPFDGSASDLVMSVNKKLKPLYKGYTLIDKR